MTGARLDDRGCAQDASMPNRPRLLRSSERLRDAGDKSNVTATPREDGGGWGDGLKERGGGVERCV